MNSNKIVNGSKTSSNETSLTNNNSGEFTFNSTESPNRLSRSEKRRGRKSKDELAREKEQMIEEEQEMMENIKRFAKLTMTYSQFLEEKIAMKSPGLSNGTKNDNSEKGTMSISNQLKYFEGGKLHQYQLEGVTWLSVLFENSVNGILADEMGLGKTIQVIALICHLYEKNVNGPYLIVVPLSTLQNWISEFKKFAPQIPCFRLQGSEAERNEQMRTIENASLTLGKKKIKPVIICSYEIVSMENKFLKKFDWIYIVVDEAHRIKNAQSKLSLELRTFHSENRLLLTGTPLQNNIKELWSLFNFLMPEIFKNIERFASLIKLDDLQDKNKVIQNEAKNKVISTIHNVLAPFMLRREKKYVFDNFVPKKEKIIYCPMTELQTYMYKLVLHKDNRALNMLPPQDEILSTKHRSCKRKINYSTLGTKKARIDVEQELSDDSLDDDDFVNMLEPSSELKSEVLIKKTVTNEHVPVKCPNTQYICRLVMQSPVTMLRKIVNHPYLVWCPLKPNSPHKEIYVSEDIVKYSGKLAVLDVLLSKLKARGHKVLIFSTSTMFLDVIEEFMILRDFKFRRLDGAVKFDDRNEAIDDYMTDPEIFIFLLSTRAGGVGLNLTAADTVIFMDRDWNPTADAQAQARCHRIGQTKPVMVYSLITKNTVDEAIVATGDMKRRLEKLVIKEGEFQSLRRKLSDDELRELEEMLNNEEEMTKVNANGLFYTDEELDDILDRSDLYKKMDQPKSKKK